MIFEPILMGAGIIVPQPGYLEAVKKLVHQHGALLAFDEVKTGLVIHQGGATAMYGVVPDIICLAKALGGGLLIGVDLMKAEDVLHAAYDDPLKITAAFNLNILRSVNAIIDSDFDVSHYAHKVVINHSKERVELYLEALRDTTVSWHGKQRVFKQGEMIHTENSHKYSIASIQDLLNRAGFQSLKVWTDQRQYFAVIYAQ
jgi:uncharacterized SAM-dependent methyltransferase